MSIVGISLGTKRTGIAVISYGTLIEWKLHTTHGRWSNEKLQRSVEHYARYLKKYRVKWLLIKIPPYTHHTPGITKLIRELLRVSQEHGCVVEYKTKAAMQAQIPEAETIHALMDYLTNRFPILLPEQERVLKASYPYHIKVFEAVLAAHYMHLQLMTNGL